MAINGYLNQYQPSKEEPFTEIVNGLKLLTTPKKAPP